MTSFYYTKFNVFEIIDGGDGMFMVEGVIVTSRIKAEKVCNFIEARKLETAYKNQNEIEYFRFNK